jgi:ribose 5-phosphate isomerase B
MRVALACDHGGFPLKDEIVQFVQEAGHEVVDLGAYRLQPADDYPDFAELVARAVQQGEADRGIVLCGSGVGAAIAANKVAGIRAGLCHDTYSARQSVEHDNANVLALGARVIGPEVAFEVVGAFLGATFSGEARHVRRVGKIEGIESRELKGMGNESG